VGHLLRVRFFFAGDGEPNLVCIEMKLNDLLLTNSIDPTSVLVLRHRPKEPELKKILPWLAGERPDLFNAYQQTQYEKLERAMNSLTGTGYVASFVGNKPGTALFIGLYSIAKATPLTYTEYWKVPAYVELKKLGMEGWAKPSDREAVLWFDLELTDFVASWKGKLIVEWPPPERSWWRRAHRNEMAVHAILEESALVNTLPNWDELEFSWEQLRVLPASWKSKLSEWRGVYYIFDTSDGKGYVGSAYGNDNLLGRWMNYSSVGHGGNRLLRSREPSNFRFTILQRVSPDLEAREVIRLENSWKERLHTRKPYGLNDN